MELSSLFPVALPGCPPPPPAAPEPVKEDGIQLPCDKARSMAVALEEHSRALCRFMEQWTATQARILEQDLKRGLEGLEGLEEKMLTPKDASSTSPRRAAAPQAPETKAPSVELRQSSTGGMSGNLLTDSQKSKGEEPLVSPGKDKQVELFGLSLGLSGNNRTMPERVYEQATQRFVDANSMIERRCAWPFLVKLERSTFFSIVSSCLILANVVALYFSTEYQIANIEDPFNATFLFVDIFFCAAYTLELLIRFAAHKLLILGSGWFWFDLLIVVGGYVEIFSSSDGEGGGSSMTQLRMLRIIRMLKMMRVIRLMRGLREVRLLLDSLMGSLKPLLWSIILVVAINFMFGLSFVQAVAGFVHHLIRTGKAKENAELIDLLLEEWGSVPVAMYTLFASSTGGTDWRDVANPVLKISPINFVIFLLYIVLFMFVMMNSITAIFVSSAEEYAQKDSSRMMQDQLARKQEYASQIYAIYNEMDEDSSGEVTAEEFREHLNDPRMIAFATSLEIDSMDLEQFFDIMSNRGDRTVDLETFVEGCIKLRGNARSMDVMDMLMSQKSLIQDVASIRSLLQPQGGHGQLNGLGT